MPRQLFVFQHVQDGKFVAVGVLRAVDAVRPDFLRQDVLLDGGEADMVEEALLVRKREHALDADGGAVFQAGLDGQKPQPLAPLILADDQRRHFSQIFPHGSQRHAADDFAVRLHENEKIADVPVEIGQGPGEKLSLESSLHQEGVDFFHVADHGLARSDITFL